MPTTRPPITAEQLDRWELFGATWRPVRHDGRVVIELCACTGELVEIRELEASDLRLSERVAGVLGDQRQITASRAPQTVSRQPRRPS